MIYYFSGTGNSHYVAEVLSKSLQDTMQSIESAQSIKQDEIIGIVTPVYFFGLPDIVKDFLERLSVSPTVAAKASVSSSAGSGRPQRYSTWR